MLRIVWKQKISPFDVCRVCGEGFMKKIIREYLEERISEEYERQIVGAFTYQIFMRDGNAEMALILAFDSQLQAFLPLGVSSKMADPDFPVPFSIIIGDRDWVNECDDGASQMCVGINKKKFGSQSNFYACPQAGHNL
mmetsp:Transcript_5064/g.8635  ORF Transcript_5064/g.8635 Transcript_5064/m.8635 type:complete len:138 (+) Transcript_5064:683-1096(+)